jgi:uncharacterized protein (TIGR02646 family)
VNGAIYPPLPGAAQVGLLTLRQRIRAQPPADQATAAKALWKQQNKKTNAAFVVIRQRLLRPSRGRRGVCAWCDHDSASQIDHVAPKHHFPELTFRWANLVPCCGRCNQTKGDKCAVIINGRRVRLTRAAGVQGPIDKLAYLHPRVDRMEDYFELDLPTGWWVAAGRSRQATKRAEQTLRTLGLNNVQFLCDARKAAWTNLRNALELAALAFEAGDQATVDEKRVQIAALPQTVWAQMKKRREQYPSIDQLFGRLPAALTW